MTKRFMNSSETNKEEEIERFPFLSDLFWMIEKNGPDRNPAR